MTGIAFLATNRNAALFLRDPSFIYRCENPAGALASAGHQSQVLHMQDYRADSGDDAVVFHRPLDSLRFRRLAHNLRRAGVCVIADIDDLIFDPDHSACSPAVVNDILPLRKIRKRFASHGRALRHVDAITVSTERIAAHLQRLALDKPVRVVPNSVHHKWRKIAEDRKPGFDSVINYCPGTRSHDRDFAEVAAVLDRFLGDHPDVRLQITGHLNQNLKARPGQVVQAQRVPFDAYAEVVRSARINLAPHEPSPFNACKSALKAIEAGYWNIPTICSPNPDMLRFAGAGAVVAETEGDWYAALERLFDDSEYAAVTDNLRDRVVARADVQDQVNSLMSVIENVSS